MKLEIEILLGEFAVCQLPPGSSPPTSPERDDLFAVIQTPEEVTVICMEEAIPQRARVEAGWRVLKVLGPLDFSLVGILAHLSDLLAEAGISIFALSTFDTDYILIKSGDLDKARAALAAAGHQISDLN
jgi:hypothetical protein